MLPYFRFVCFINSESVREIKRDKVTFDIVVCEFVSSFWNVIMKFSLLTVNTNAAEGDCCCDFDCSSTAGGLC